MKLFVRTANIERKSRVEKHFKERGIDTYFEIIWNDGYPKEHPMVRWLKQTLCKHMSIETISGYIKMFDVLKQSRNDEYIMIVDDDVVFPEDWKQRFEMLDLKAVNFLSRGVNFHIPPTNDYTVTGNIGGSETIVFSRQFLNFFENNIDFRQAVDIVIGAMTLVHGLQLAITPITHQTSILEYKSTYNHDETKYDLDWVTFTKTYKPSGLKMVDIETAFEDFMLKKKLCEDDFLKRFNTVIDIWNIEYVYKNSELIL